MTLGGLLLMIMVFMILIIFTIIGIELLKYIKKSNEILNQTKHLLDKIDEKV